MSPEPGQKLATRDAAAIRSECSRLAKIETPPFWIPSEVISAEVWKAYSEHDREESAFYYRNEVLGSLEGLQPEFPVVKTPTGGSLHWILPNGEPPSETIKAVILAHYPLRGWWKSEQITNTLPDCSSTDMIRPESGKGPTGAATCAECPHNKFGSGKGRSKACKERKNIFFLREGHAIPWKYCLPPSALDVYDAHVTGLVDGKKPKAIAAVVTEFSLKLATGSTGNPYSLLHLKIDRVLRIDEMMACTKIRDRFVELMQRSGMTVETDEPEWVKPAGQPTKPATAGREPGDEDPPPRGDSDIPDDIRL